jgi:hypothetical protein
MSGLAMPANLGNSNPHPVECLERARRRLHIRTSVRPARHGLGVHERERGATRHRFRIDGGRSRYPTRRALRKLPLDPNKLAAFDAASGELSCNGPIVGQFAWARLR